MVHEAISNDFVKRWKDFYGKTETKEILKALYQTDPRVIAPNVLRITINQLKQSLEKRGFRFHISSSFSCLITDYEPFNIVATPEYLTGQFSIQALTSVIPPRSLNPSPEAIVADLTASPGIKTCLLAQVMENTGTIFAFEKAKKRIPALKANISRMGIFNTVVLNCDALLFPDLQIKVDHILLDAPCSGTGLKLAKNKRLEQRLLTDISRQSLIQQQLLDSAWDQLKIGGTLAYSTCSLEPEEGEVQIHNFLHRHPEQAELLPLRIDIGLPGSETHWIEKLNPMLKNTCRIFPAQGIDGFFITMMRKVNQK